MSAVGGAEKPVPGSAEEVPHHTTRLVDFFLFPRSFSHADIKVIPRLIISNFLGCLHQGEGCSVDANFAF
jgi:hypothetical protein